MSRPPLPSRTSTSSTEMTSDSLRTGIASSEMSAKQLEIFNYVISDLKAQLTILSTEMLKRAMELRLTEAGNYNALFPLVISNYLVEPIHDIIEPKIDLLSSNFEIKKCQYNSVDDLRYGSMILTKSMIYKTSLDLKSGYEDNSPIYDATVRDILSNRITDFQDMILCRVDDSECYLKTLLSPKGRRRPGSTLSSPVGSPPLSGEMGGKEGVTEFHLG
jgi:hypothetical protein